jgi:ABC-type branched-subunit amino acid transport system permease subunit
MQYYSLNDPVSILPNKSIALLAMNVAGGTQTNFWSGPMLGTTIGGGMTPSQWTSF